MGVSSVAARGPYAYSQEHRGEPGYHDCSSWVMAVLEEAGVHPGFTYTGNVGESPNLLKVGNPAEVRTGDIFVEFGIRMTESGDPEVVGHMGFYVTTKDGIRMGLSMGTSGIRLTPYGPMGRGVSAVSDYVGGMHYRIRWK